MDARRGPLPIDARGLGSTSLYMLFLSPTLSSYVQDLVTSTCPYHCNPRIRIKLLPNMPESLPTFWEDPMLMHIRSHILKMQLERKLEAVLLSNKALMHSNEALQLEAQRSRYMLGGVATRDLDANFIVGRRTRPIYWSTYVHLDTVIRLNTTDEGAPPKNEFHQLAHWASIEQAHEHIARRIDVAKAQFHKNTDPSNVGQIQIIRSYTVEKLQVLLTLVSPRQLPYMSGV